MHAPSSASLWTTLLVNTSHACIVLCYGLRQPAHATACFPNSCAIKAQPAARHQTDCRGPQPPSFIAFHLKHQLPSLCWRSVKNGTASLLETAEGHSKAVTPAIRGGGCLLTQVGSGRHEWDPAGTSGIRQARVGSGSPNRSRMGGLHSTPKGRTIEVVAPCV